MINLLSINAGDIDFGSWNEVYNKYINNKANYEYVQITGTDGTPKNVLATSARFLDLTYADKTIFYYKSTGLVKTPYILTIAKGSTDRYGVSAVAEDGGLQSEDGVYSIKKSKIFDINAQNELDLKLSKDFNIGIDGEISIPKSLSFVPVRDTFNSIAGKEVTLSTPVDNIDKYIVNMPVALENTNGTLGEIWIVKETTKFTVYNSGSFTGKFETSYALV